MDRWSGWSSWSGCTPTGGGYMGSYWGELHTWELMTYVRGRESNGWRRRMVTSEVLQSGSHVLVGEVPHGESCDQTSDLF